MRHVSLFLFVLLGGCHRGDGAAQDQDLATPEQHPDEHVAMAAEHAMAGMVSNEDLHLRLTPLRPIAPGDSTRAAEVLAVMRRELSRYRDVRVAQEDGFRNYIPPPGAAAPVQHFTKIRWALQARSGLDPSRPTSLLYQRAADGSLELVGAMFTAPPQTTEDALNARLPLSMARWHQHINWCLPPLADARRRWGETKNGQPVFGPKSPIATAEACEAVGGRFRPRLFGWMVHVMAFSSNPWTVHGDAHDAHHD